MQDCPYQRTRASPRPESTYVSFGRRLRRIPHLPFLNQIFLAGLALQLASFFLFVLVVLRFLFRVATMEPHTWRMDAEKPWHKDWRTLSYALIVSSIGIMVSKHRGFRLTISADLLSV